MRTDVKQIKELFLKDPISGEDMDIVSPIKPEGNGKYPFKHSFIVKNFHENRSWRHIIHTEEVDNCGYTLDDYLNFIEMDHRDKISPHALKLIAKECRKLQAASKEK